MTDSEQPHTLRWYAGQAWRDLLSVYYANTPVWRWLKSGTLVFFGFFLWAGSVVVQSVTGWTLLNYVMAYGFLLIAWGPLTHFVVVPLTIRLRRTAQHPATRWLSMNSGKTNLTIFFTLVILLATFAPGMMALEFSPSVSDDGGVDVRGEVVCETGAETVSCQVENAQGIDHVVVLAGGTQLTTAEEPPFAFEVDRDNLTEIRIGQKFLVEFRDADGNTVRTLSKRVE